MIGNIKKFSTDVRSEMKKVSWPSKEQLKESTYVVIGVSLVITALVAAMDTIVSFGIDSIFGL
jgi:preprotein translocase subunit SecE